MELWAAELNLQNRIYRSWFTKVDLQSWFLTFWLQFAANHCGLKTEMICSTSSHSAAGKHLNTLWTLRSNRKALPLHFSLQNSLNSSAWVCFPGEADATWQAVLTQSNLKNTFKKSLTVKKSDRKLNGSPQLWVATREAALSPFSIP